MVKPNHGDVVGTIMRDGIPYVVRFNLKEPVNHVYIENNNPIHVWIDLENCVIPSDMKEEFVRHRIKRSLRMRGYRGEVHIRAIFARWTDNVIEERVLKFRKIHPVHLGYDSDQNQPPDDAADAEIVAEIELFLQQKPEPCNVLIISGDGYFNTIFENLKRENFITMTAYKPGTCSEEVRNGLVRESWYWRDLLGLGDYTGNRKSVGQAGDWVDDSEEAEEAAEEADVEAA